MGALGRTVCLLVAVVALAALQPARVAASELQMRLINNIVRCSDNSVIKFSACEFRRYPSNSVVNRTHLNDGWMVLHAALEGSVCDVTLSNRFPVNAGFMIGCRVLLQDAGDKWEATEKLFYRQDDGLFKEESPTSSVTGSLKSVGNKLEISASSSYIKELKNCTFQPLGQVEYIGRGGSCQVNETIHSAAPNALVVRANGGDLLALAKPVNTVAVTSSLNLTRLNTTFVVGDVLEASCRVSTSEGVVWTLDIETIFDDKCVRTKSWPWRFEDGGCTSELNHTISWRDHGRTLYCKTDETADDGPIINVLFKPQITGFEWKWMDSKVVSVVNVTANPVPEVTWSINGIVFHSDTELLDSSQSHKYVYNNSNSDTLSLVVTVTATNVHGSTSVSSVIGASFDERFFLVVVSATLGAVSLALAVAVVVLAVLRCRGQPPGSPCSCGGGGGCGGCDGCGGCRGGCGGCGGCGGGGLRGGEQPRGRCKVVVSGIYAEVDEAIDYDEEPEYDDVDLQPELAPAPAPVQMVPIRPAMAQPNPYNR